MSFREYFVRLPNASWVDLKAVIGLEVGEQSKDFPDIQDRVLIRLVGGSVQVIGPFPSLVAAQAWADDLGVRVAEAKGRYESSCD